MEPEATVFAIPTYRLRDVAEAIEAYDANFWRNGHTVNLMVFDNSSVANHEKYFPLLENTRTVNELYCVGPREKEEFLGVLNRKLRDKKLESLVKNLFRPSDGGTRNCTLMWTLGKFLSQIRASLEIWPTLVEVCYYYKDKKPLPQIRVKNKRLETHR